MTQTFYLKQQAAIYAAAFNLGADARIAGDARSNCPLDCVEDRSAWRKGWNDVDQHWGEQNRTAPKLARARKD